MPFFLSAEKQGIPWMSWISIISILQASLRLSVNGFLDYFLLRIFIFFYPPWGCPRLFVWAWTANQSSSKIDLLTRTRGLISFDKETKMANLGIFIELELCYDHNLRKSKANIESNAEGKWETENCIFPDFVKSGRIHLPLIFLSYMNQSIHFLSLP
jgi:hypothetical protein